jgi:signal peptide peptidase SppA
MKTYNRIITAVYGSIWAIEQGKLDDICAFLEFKVAGGVPEEHLLAGIRAANEISAAKLQKVTASTPGSVSVLPLYGLIMPRAGMMGDISGPRGTSLDQFKQQFRQAMNDPSVKAIVIDVDSPGGSVQGVDELASEIHAARGKKEVTAVVSGICASAAYYLASGAAKIVASPSSQVGSIGVYGALRDDTVKNEKDGVKHTVVIYGANKALGDPRTPTTQAAVDDLQESVDSYGGMFDAAVARGRKVTQAHVRENYGQGKMFLAKKAKQLGMVDDIGTLDDVLAGYGVGDTSARSQMAEHSAGIIAAEQPIPDQAVAVKLGAMRRELELAGA